MGEAKDQRREMGTGEIIDRVRTVRNKTSAQPPGMGFGKREREGRERKEKTG